MSAIGPGDYAEYIADDSDHFSKGDIVRVRAFALDCLPCVSCGDDAPGIELDGVWDPYAAFCGACELRPIYRPKSEVIESLKQPAPDAVREPVTAD